MTDPTRTGSAEWRLMRRGDLDAVLRIADLVHPALPEPPEVFANRLALWPAGTLVLEDGAGIAGYAIGHPIRFPEPPALGAVMDRLAPDADAFYVHDVAIVPEMRGRSLAGAALGQLLASASGLRRACLVSVYGTAAFWSRFGFEDAGHLVRPEKLHSFGEGARFMVSQLTPHEALSDGVSAVKLP
ncbi:GNAT family N-acetyltransferase [Fulvimarina sp. 2208YS6-2-32]|uniref:GNAT family N-acetyltransferase n=1 Tax=Fulvimarina uroteuthidis TaxID=3098149 RepID=A0ABU5HYU6_9HYPH|nr:GNAT family N-acetyltransferase [Fulvimarina sp. 2208YS6-2-32]MDY8107943.1 GNAT family N-acetyltransferase [Fulvimarina sp. 2208YS6-2-32]